MRSKLLGVFKEGEKARTGAWWEAAGRTGRRRTAKSNRSTLPGNSGEGFVGGRL